MPETRLGKRIKHFKYTSNMFAGIKGENALQQLSEKVDELSSKNTLLSLEETAGLIRLYEKSGVQLQKAIDQDKKGEKFETTLHLDTLKRIAKDYAALNRYRNRLKARQDAGKKADPLTLEEFYDLSRSRTISLNGQSLSEMKKTGAGSSVRYVVPVPYKDEPLPFPLEKGVPFNAYFTENITYDEKDSSDTIMVKEEKAIIKQVIEDYPAMKDCLRMEDPEQNSGLFMDLRRMYEKETGRFLRDKITNVLPVLGLDATLQQMNKILGSASDDGRKIMNKIRSAEPEKKYEMLMGLISYTTAVMKTMAQEAIRKINDIDRKTAIGKRNALTSNMAELFGCGDVIAYSEKVNIRTLENGKEVTKRGVIMMPAAGEDMNSAGFNSNLAKLDRTKLEGSPELIKQVASLQFLDTICGNTDRHIANYFYRFDKKGKLVGVQGIDNDNSFGGRVNTAHQFGHGVAFEDLRIIPKSMADKVMSMDPDTFAVFLHGYDLTTDEIHTSLKRFSILKENLAASEKHYDGIVPGHLDPLWPRIVPDEEMQLYSFNEQLVTQNTKQNGRNENLFGQIAQIAETRQSSINEQITTVKQQLFNDAYDFTNGFAKKGRDSLSGNLAQMDELSKVKKGETKDAGFNAMLKATTELMSDRTIWDKLTKASNITAGSALTGIIQIPTMDGGRKVSTEPKKIPREEAVLSKAVREVLVNSLYKKMDKALESTYEYLSSDASVELADKYQQLQLDLKEATDEKRTADREKILESLNKLKESKEFKRYMSAVKNRDKLQEQMDRYVKVKEHGDALEEAAARFNAYYLKPAANDPYTGSDMQKATIQRLSQLSETAQKQKAAKAAANRKNRQKEGIIRK